jgi:WD40 repeat protein
MKVYDTNHNLIESFQAHTNIIRRIKQSPFNNQYVASCSEDNTVKIWNKWNLIQTYTKHTDYVNDLEWISKEAIASGSNDNTIQIWSINTGHIQRTIKTESDVNALQLINNGIQLACNLGYNGQINIYNLNDGNLISTFFGHTSWVNLLVLVNESLLASSSHDTSIRIWDLKTKKEKFVLNGHSNRVYGLKLLTPNIIASASWDKTIKLWNIQNGSEIRTLMGHSSPIFWSLDLLNDGKTLVSGSYDKTIKLWDWMTGECLKTIETGSTIHSLSIIKINQ